MKRLTCLRVRLFFTPYLLIDNQVIIIIMDGLVEKNLVSHSDMLTTGGGERERWYHPSPF